MTAPSVPTNAIVNFGNLRSDGSEMFISGVVTLSGAGAADVPHGLTALSGSGGRVSAGATPTVAFYIPVSGDDFSATTLAVDGTNVVLAAGPSGGKLLVVAIR